MGQNDMCGITVKSNRLDKLAKEQQELKETIEFLKGKLKIIENYLDKDEIKEAK